MKIAGRPGAAAGQAAAQVDPPGTPVGASGGHPAAMLVSPRANPAAISPAHFARGGEAPPGTAEASDIEDVADMSYLWWANDDSGDEEQGEEDHLVEHVASDALEEKAVLAAAAEEGSDPCLLGQALEEHVQGQVQQVLRQAWVNKGLQDFDFESAADGDPPSLRKPSVESHSSHVSSKILSRNANVSVEDE
jgi:hypothetical protein